MRWNGIAFCLGVDSGGVGLIEGLGFSVLWEMKLLDEDFYRYSLNQLFLNIYSHEPTGKLGVCH